MKLQTKTIMIIGIALAIIHIILIASNYNQLLQDTLGMAYVGFFSIFFVLWGCMHLLSGRLFAINQQAYSAARVNPMMKKYVSLKQYYQSELEKEELLLNLRANASKYSCVFDYNPDGDIQLSSPSDKANTAVHVGIKLFSEDNGSTVATEIQLEQNEYISTTKIGFAIALFIATFFGVIAFVFAFGIHIVSMIEITKFQKNTRTNLKTIDKIIQESIGMTEY